jgi:hypothetical protein
VIILSARSGQLGNRLLFCAYAISLAEASGQRLVNLSFGEYMHHFPGANKANGFYQVPLFAHKALRFLIKLLHLLPPLQSFFVNLTMENSAGFSPGNPAFVSTVRNRRLTFLEGWFDVSKMTFPSPGHIRAIFLPRPDVQKSVAEHLARARANADVLIGLHIRWGDYATFAEGRHFYSLETYREIMEKTAALFPHKKVAFLVCSSEPQQAKAFAPLAVTLGPGTVIGDLYSLAGCDYILGPPSTYTFWAAFYGLKPLYRLTKPDAPTNLDQFSIPDGDFLKWKY